MKICFHGKGTEITDNEYLLVLVLWRIITTMCEKKYVEINSMRFMQKTVKLFSCIDWHLEAYA